jgi:hypothetical protein
MRPATAPTAHYSRPLKPSGLKSATSAPDLLRHLCNQLKGVLDAVLVQLSTRRKRLVDGGTVELWECVCGVCVCVCMCLCQVGVVW